MNNGGGGGHKQEPAKEGFCQTSPESGRRLQKPPNAAELWSAQWALLHQDCLWRAREVSLAAGPQLEAANLCTCGRLSQGDSMPPATPNGLGQLNSPSSPLPTPLPRLSFQIGSSPQVDSHFICPRVGGSGGTLSSETPDVPLAVSGHVRPSSQGLTD